MTYSVENWRKAIINVMMDGKLRPKEDIIDLAYRWLIRNNVLTEEEKKD